MLGAGAAIAAAGVSAVKSAADFEATMSGVKAVSGATQEEMKGLQSLALQLGADTAFSASEAAAGIEELVKGGLSVEDVMGGAAKATLNLAAAGGTTLPEAAEIASNAVGQFNLKGADMAHVSDMIAGAANASSISVGDFRQSLAAVGAVAATVGFSFDDTAVAIAQMGQAGIKSSDAGTSLKTMLMNLEPSTKAAASEMARLGLFTVDYEQATGVLTTMIGQNAAAQDALSKKNKDGQLSFQEIYKVAKDYGVAGAEMSSSLEQWAQQQGFANNQFFDAQGKVKSLAEVSEVLRGATADLTEQQRLASLELIFGSDAIRAAAVLSRGGAAGFNEMAGAMGKVTAASVGAERLNNLNGALEQLQGSLETAAIELGVQFLPLLKELAMSATAAINAFIPFIREHGPGFVAALQAVFGAIGTVVGAFVDLKQWVDEHWAAQVALSAVLGATTAALGVQAAAWVVNTARLIATQGVTTAMTAAQWLLNAALTANPIGVVVVALGALAGALIYAYNHSETFRNVVDGAFAAVRSAVEAMWNAVKPILDAFGAALNAVQEAAGKVRDAIANLPALPSVPGQAAVPSRDAGGPVQAGGLYEIGKGPYREYFAPGASGMVYPVGGGGPTSVTVPVYIGGEQVTTVVARANERYAARGGHAPRAATVPGGWR